MTARPPPRYLYACASALALASCTEIVVVAADCKPGDTMGPCVVATDGSPAQVGNDMDAGVELDGALPTLDAALTMLDAADATTPPDAIVAAPDDATVWQLPELKNPSFELTDGQPGDVATVSLPTGTVIAPWFSCQPIGGGQGALTGVRAEQAVPLVNEGAAPDLVRAPEGRTFVAMQYFVTLLPPVLVQQLATPLKVGTNYGFAIDVRTSNAEADLSLGVYGSKEACDTLNATPLKVAPPIVSSGWQTICLRFTTPFELAYLMLVETAAAPVSGDRLFLDNLRSVESCPP